MVEFYLLSIFKILSCLFNLLTQFEPGKRPVKVSFLFLAWAFPGHAQNGPKSHYDMTNINSRQKIISHFEFGISESEMTKIFLVGTHPEHVLLPRFLKNADREISKHRRCQELNLKSNGLGLIKIVRLELENGRFEVLNLSALWCSSGACVSVVNSSLGYFLGRENRSSKPNRS